MSRERQAGSVPDRVFFYSLHPENLQTGSSSQSKREIVGCLTQEVTRLEEENQKLNQTVSLDAPDDMGSQLKRTPDIREGNSKITK